MSRRQRTLPLAAAAAAAVAILLAGCGTLGFERIDLPKPAREKQRRAFLVLQPNRVLASPARRRSLSASDLSR